MNVYIRFLFYFVQNQLSQTFPAAQVPLYGHQNGNWFITIRIYHFTVWRTQIITNNKLL